MEDAKHISLQVRILIWTIVVMIVLVATSSYTKYIFAKEYYFHVEAPCDSSTNICYVRDCEDYCPPNGLSEYTVYEIKAIDYVSCHDNSCTNVCTESATSNKCGEIECNVAQGDECST